MCPGTLLAATLRVLRGRGMCGVASVAGWGTPVSVLDTARHLVQRRSPGPVTPAALVRSVLTTGQRPQGPDATATRFDPALLSAAAFAFFLAFAAMLSGRTVAQGIGLNSANPPAVGSRGVYVDRERQIDAALARSATRAKRLISGICAGCTDTGASRPLLPPLDTSRLVASGPAVSAMRSGASPVRVARRTGARRLAGYRRSRLAAIRVQRRAAVQQARQRATRAAILRLALAACRDEASAQRLRVLLRRLRL